MLWNNINPGFPHGLPYALPRENFARPPTHKVFSTWIIFFFILSPLAPVGVAYRGFVQFFF